MTTNRTDEKDELVFALPDEPAHRPQRYALPRWLVDRVIATEWAPTGDPPRHTTRRQTHRVDDDA